MSRDYAACSLADRFFLPTSASAVSAGFRQFSEIFIKLMAKLTAEKKASTVLGAFRNETSKCSGERSMSSSGDLDRQQNDQGRRDGTVLCQC
jgi:hypothetical protein